MRVFLDTNILLDILLNRAELVEESSAVILLCESSRHEIFIAWHGLATAYYLLRRGRSEAAAQLEVAKILSWAKVAEVSDASAREALSLDFGDFEDALQVVAASACGANCIVTQNLSDFLKSATTALTPRQFIDRFSAK